MGLHGLLPPAVLTQKEQVQSVLTNLYALEDDLGRYNTLMSLQDRNEKLFYKVRSDFLPYPSFRWLLAISITSFLSSTLLRLARLARIMV